MSERVFYVSSFTPTAINDATNLTDGAHMTIGSTGALIGTLVKEIYIGGQASASTVNNMVFARNSQISGTATALSAPNSDGPKNGFSAMGAAKVMVAATVTTPQRSAAVTVGKLPLAHNAFGGVVRWLAPPGGEWMIFGVTTNISESSLSCQGAGGGAVSAAITYEVL